MLSEYSTIRERHVDAGGIALFVREVGNPENPAIVLLHGFPETGLEWLGVMERLQHKYYLIAPDLPGIGESAPLERHDKASVARSIRELIVALQLDKPLLIGHDAGGMVTYAYLRNYPDTVSGAGIVCTAIPGVQPWEQVKANPYIWHFAFFAIPGLPETLIHDKLPELFEYFYSTLAFDKAAIDAERKAAYVRAYSTEIGPKTGLGWYRRIPEDEKANAERQDISVPLLYLKGAKDFGDIEEYVAGFKANGVQNIDARKVPDSAHFAPEENPAFVAAAIATFADKCFGHPAAAL